MSVTLFPLDDDFDPDLCNFLPTMAGKFVSHHHRHSAWQRTELWRVYGDTGVMETDWATAGVRRYRGSGDVRNDGEYIFGRPRGR